VLPDVAENSLDTDFEYFYSTMYRPLLRALMPLVLEVTAAEEVAQEAFLRAYKNWSRLSAYDDPQGWLYRVAMRLAISRWRRLRSAASALRRYGPPVAVDGPDEMSVAVFAALARLPLTQRQVLVMHHMLGYPVGDVAAELQVPVGTVKARLSRGRAALAPLLTDVEEALTRG
jgi:RNA polymerase sigma-70 factor, ECF subfamily